MPGPPGRGAESPAPPPASTVVGDPFWRDAAAPAAVAPVDIAGTIYTFTVPAGWQKAELLNRPQGAYRQELDIRGDRSKAADKIGPVIRNGRPDKGMPRFDRSDDQIESIVAFIHTQQTRVLTRTGGRKGVDPEALQTGNAEAGKQYFNGAGGCSTCHSPTGDLAGIASRHQGLELERRMLYPRHAKSKVRVTLTSGQTVAGTLEYLDEFTVGLIDSAGTYRSWRTRDVKFKVDSPVDAHVALFDKYTDDDVHNLMAYLQTLH